MLGIDDRAPDFEARHQDGRSVRLSELRGHHVLVYFYPKDQTRGCTAEACGLRDSLEDLTACGADVLGVSTDSWEAHSRFQARHDLTFALASDPKRTIAAAYGVGRMLGILPVLTRTSFLVGPDGDIVEVWPSVNAERHASEVLQAVRRRTATTAG